MKLDIYRKFTNALAVAVIASVSWIGYEVEIFPPCYNLTNHLCTLSMIRCFHFGLMHSRINRKEKTEAVH